MSPGPAGYVVDLPIGGTPPGTPLFYEPDLHGFDLGRLEPPRYAIEQLIPIGVVTLLAAHGGAGKSILAEIIAAHFAAARAWAGFEVLGGRALFVSLEDPAALVVERLRRIAAAYSLDAAKVAENLIVLDGSDGDGALGREHNQLAAREFRQTPRFDFLRERAVGARLIVIDNASDAFDGNENERRMVREFMRMLAQLARDNDAAVLLLAHVDKQTAKHGGAGNTYSGSTAWHNSARSRLALVEASGKVELRQEKLNVGRALQSPVELHWSQHGVLVPWETTTPRAAANHDGDAADVLAALKEAVAHSINVPTARTGPATAQKALETTDALPAALRGADGRDRFWRAMNQLQREKCAGSEEYRNADRKVRTRFVPLEGAPVGCARQSPIPPVNWSGAGPLSAPVFANGETGAEPAQTGARCQRCDDEGCHHCDEGGGA